MTLLALFYNWEKEVPSEHVLFESAPAAAARLEEKKVNAHLWTVQLDREKDGY